MSTERFPKLKESYQAARAERKALETEGAEIDDRIFKATVGGDVQEVRRLKTRKEDWPALFAAASHAELEARRTWHNAERDAAIKIRDEAQTALDTFRQETQKRIADHEADMAERAKDDMKAVDRLATENSTVGVWSSAMSKGDVAHKTALAGLGA